VIAGQYLVLNISFCSYCIVINFIGANLEAEDSDGDTALHLVLLQMKQSRQGSGGMAFLLNVLFRVQPQNMDKAPAIKKAWLMFCYKTF